MKMSKIQLPFVFMQQNCLKVSKLIISNAGERSLNGEYRRQGRFRVCS